MRQVSQHHLPISQVTEVALANQIPELILEENHRSKKHVNSIPSLWDQFQRLFKNAVDLELVHQTDWVFGHRFQVSDELIARFGKSLPRIHGIRQRRLQVVVKNFARGHEHACVRSK